MKKEIDGRQSVAYGNYLRTHIEAVTTCYNLLTGGNRELMYHDKSKFSYNEYDQYARYFFTEDGKDKTERTEQERLDFRRAWLHHQNENPHHWQYWILIDGDGDFEPLEMPKKFVYEMVADWGAFSLIEKKPNNIVGWYDTHKDKIILHEDTRKLVEELVPRMAACIRKHLEYLDEIASMFDTEEDFEDEPSSPLEYLMSRADADECSIR